MSTSQPGKLYWSLIKPVWLPLNLSWDGGTDAFVQLFQATPIKTGHLYAAHWCQSEVSNGGLWQFFYNTTGLLAPEALRGFEAIGLHDWATILANAMAFFGDSYPRERSVRHELLPKAGGRKREEWDPFSKLDDRFFNWFHSDWDRWDREADRYAENA